MEQYRKRIALFFVLFTLSVLIGKWYYNIDHKRTYVDVNEKELNNSEKIEKFGFVNVDNYDAFYKNEVTILETRTNIPFVWKKTILNQTQTKLYTKSY